MELGTLLVASTACVSGLLWAGGHLHLEEAQAAEYVGPRAPQLPVEDRAIPAAAMEPASMWDGPIATGTFLGKSDEELLEPLRTGKLVSVKVNRGGTSISLRLTFDNGSRAAFKPQQTNYQTIPRKEVAAYRISRLLSLESVQPAIGRAFPMNELIARLRPDSRRHAARLRQEMINRSGKVIGEMSWWIPVIKTPKIDGFRIDEVEGIVTWKRHLKAKTEVPAEHAELLAQLSNMLVFDFLINNPDRWSGGNARASADGRKLFFMDNTLSFGPHPRAARKVRLYMARTQKFSRRLVEHLRNLDEELVIRALEEDPGAFEFLLTDRELEAMFSRKAIILAYVDELIAEH
ncbi:MAG: hypothetical protein KJO07_14225, partial [Deltaproteobacteria bacterium]|nr:hypothetical protein [Deltaproteobacteria bacterium]